MQVLTVEPPAEIAFPVSTARPMRSVLDSGASETRVGGKQMRVVCSPDKLV
jgi:hypothetical protein